MKSRFFVVSLMAELLAAGSLWAWYTGVSGKVADEANGNPIAGAQIGIFNHPYGMQIGQGMSDSSGAYTVNFGIPARTCTVYVNCEKIGYQPEWWDDTPFPDSADPVVVINGQITHGIDFLLASMDTSSGISGKVREESSGTPIGGADVLVYVYPDTTTPVAYGYTINNGSYLIHLPPDQYYVRAEKQGYEGEWYNEGNLTFVAVQSGDVIPNIDFTLAALCGGAISGLVLDEANNYPIQWAFVELHTDPFAPPVDFAITDYQGFYKFVSVPAGTYYAMAAVHGCIPEWWDNELLPDSADPIVVANQLVPNIDFYLVCGDTTDKGAVGGHVKDASSNAPIQGAHVRILHTHLSAYTDWQGKYLIQDVPVGTQTVKAMAQGYYPGTDSCNVVDNDTAIVNFALAPDTSWMGDSISGGVTETDTTIPISGAAILVYPVSDSFPVGWSCTNHQGNYVVHWLQPGDYHVMAHAQAHEDEWYYESPDRQGATIVTVYQSTNTAGIDFTLESESLGGIAGTVMDTSGAGIPFAFVEATGLNNWFQGQDIADSTGAYLIEDLMPGLYKVEAVAQGYLPGLYPGPVEVIADSITPDIDIVLEEIPHDTSWISGVVTDDSTFAPIPHALVMVFACQPPVTRFGFTDSSGVYTVENVPCTSDSVYYAFAFAGGYIPEFYDNVYSWLDATAVPANSDAINFELGTWGGKGGDSGPMGICGRIVEAKAGIPDAIVYAMDGNQILGASRSLDDGFYLVNQLPPGTYNLKVTRVGYEDVVYGPVSVVESNATGVDIPMIAVGTEEPVTPIPKKLWLSVAPNIANHKAIIHYGIPSETDAQLSVYDVSGREVVTLVKGKAESGTHLAILNIRALSQGVYFVRLTSGKKQVVKKLIVIR